MLTNNKIQNNQINNHCSNCGECCTDFFPLTAQDVAKIKTYLDVHPEVKEQIHIENNNMHFACAFRDYVNKQCLVYEVRPDICKLFKCNQSMTLMNQNKMSQHLKAKFNCIDIQGKLINMASTHAIFFGNTQWDYDVLYAMTGYNKKAFMTIVYPTLAFKPGDKYEK